MRVNVDSLTTEKKRKLAEIALRLEDVNERIQKSDDEAEKSDLFIEESALSVLLARELRGHV